MIVLPASMRPAPARMRLEQTKMHRAQIEMRRAQIKMQGRMVAAQGIMTIAAGRKVLTWADETHFPSGGHHGIWCCKPNTSLTRPLRPSHPPPAA